MNGATLCVAHQQQRRRRLTVRILALGAALAAIISVLANLSEIAQYFALRAPAVEKAKLPSGPDLVQEMLQASNSIILPRIESDAALEHYAELCDVTRSGPSLFKCRMILGIGYQSGSRYKLALRNFNLARDQAAQFADTYYGRGMVYYDLALFDLIRRGRFKIDATEPACVAFVDDRTRLLLGVASAEFAEGSRYQTYRDAYPSEHLVLIPMNLIAHQREQMRIVAAGGSTISFDKLDIVTLFSWVVTQFPADDPLVDQAALASERAMEYMRTHPNEFPLLPREVFDSE